MHFSKTLHIFTYHDHFFQVSECWTDERRWHTLSDEHGSEVELEDLSLSAIGHACRTVIDDYARALEEQFGQAAGGAS